MRLHKAKDLQVISYRLRYNGFQYNDTRQKQYRYLTPEDIAIFIEGDKLMILYTKDNVLELPLFRIEWEIDGIIFRTSYGVYETP